MLLKLAVIWVALTAVIVAVVMQMGILLIDVRDASAGKHIYLPIPMAAVTAGAWLIPGHIKNELQQELGVNRSAFQKLMQQFAACPDGTFMEIDSRDGRATIQKQEDYLLIDVSSTEDEVHIRIPIRSSSRAIAYLVGTD